MVSGFPECESDVHTWPAHPDSRVDCILFGQRTLAKTSRLFSDGLQFSFFEDKLLVSRVCIEKRSFGGALEEIETFQQNHSDSTVSLVIQLLELNRRNGPRLAS